MKPALVAFTRRGIALARRILAGLEGGSLHVPPRLAEETGERAYPSLEEWTAQQWRTGGALIFVGAAGIAVRAIAPHVADKFTDPCVVSVDEEGRFAVPLLSGHVGGGNRLAGRLAALTGGQAACSTATDLHGLFAVDLWAKERGYVLADRALAKAVSAALLEGEPVGFASDLGHPVPRGLTSGVAQLGIWVTCRAAPGPFPRTLRLIPPCLTLGIGCRRGVCAQAVAQAVAEALAGYDPAAVRQVATIDLKEGEPGLLAFCREMGWPLRFYTARELAAAEGTFTASPFVKAVTGVDNVCERAAVLAGGTLLVPKRALSGVTVAVAGREQE